MTPIIDSVLTTDEALADNPAFPCPLNIRYRLCVVPIQYISFDSALHEGHIVVHEFIREAVQSIFNGLKSAHFPIAHAIPIAHQKYSWDDIRSMEDNNTSGFNYRYISGTQRLSWHAYGTAIDINPLLNPYERNGYVEPEGATYDVNVLGTITQDSSVVKLFKSYGFSWGGDWSDRKDYQHFEKPLPASQL